MNETGNLLSDGRSFVSNQVTKASPASLPNCSKSCAMVVSGGSTRAAAWISSNPIIENLQGYDNHAVSRDSWSG